MQDERSLEDILCDLEMALEGHSPAIPYCRSLVREALDKVERAFIATDGFYIRADPKRYQGGGWLTKGGKPGPNPYCFINQDALDGFFVKRCKWGSHLQTKFYNARVLSKEGSQHIEDYLLEFRERRIKLSQKREQAITNAPPGGPFRHPLDRLRAIQSEQAALQRLLAISRQIKIPGKKMMRKIVSGEWVDVEV